MKKKTEGKGKQFFLFLITRDKLSHNISLKASPNYHKGVLSKTNSNNDSVNGIGKRKQPFTDVRQNVFLKILQYPHEKHQNICVRVSLE